MRPSLLILCIATVTHGFSIGPFSSSWVAEAEKKHARTAMLAFPTLLALQTVTDHPVQWLNDQSVAMQVSAYSAAAVLESVNLARLDNGFTLKPGETAGKVLNVKSSDTLSKWEDTVGRACMLGATAFLVSAL